MRTKSLRLSTLLVLALVPAALAGDLEDGLALKEARKYEEALPKLQAAADADPGNAEAALALSEVHLGLGDAESAAKAARAGHDAHPQHVGLLVALARAHMMRADQAAAAGENGQLIQSFAADCDLAVKKALEIDTDNADAGFLRAKVLQHQGGSDAGLPQLEAVAGSHPDHFDTQFELGRYWFLKGRLDNADMEAWAKAEEHFTNAAGIDPQSGLALLNAAYAAQWQGKTEGLAEKYEKAAILLPGDDGPLKQIHTVMRADPAECVAAFTRISATRPTDSQVLIWLAYTQGDAGDFDAALKTLAKAGKEDPENVWVDYNRAKTLRRANKIDEAIGAFEKVAKRWKGLMVTECWDQMSYYLAVQDAALEPKQRERLWTAVFEACPEFAASANRAGLWYRDTGKDYKKSLEWYLRAAEYAPDSPGIQNDTGLIYHYHTSDQEKAIPYYQRAIELGEEQGRNWRGSQDVEDVGYRDAMNNMGKLLVDLKKWKALAEFVENHVPEEHPLHASWSGAAAKKGR